MPIHIYFEDKERSEIAWLCDGEWKLPDQMKALLAWAEKQKGALKEGKKSADLGFAIRNDAAGGGAVLTAENMKMLSDLDIDLYLSEYSFDIDEEES